jgi:hypothetical protein
MQLDGKEKELMAVLEMTRWREDTNGLRDSYNHLSPSRAKERSDEYEPECCYRPFADI